MQTYTEPVPIKYGKLGTEYQQTDIRIFLQCTAERQTAAVVVEHGAEDVGISVEEELSGRAAGSGGSLVRDAVQSGAGPACQRPVLGPVDDSADVERHRVAFDEPLVH